MERLVKYVIIALACPLALPFVDITDEESVRNLSVERESNDEID